MLDKLKNIFSIENRTKYFIHVLVYFLIISIVIFIILIIGGKSQNRDANIAIKEKINPFQNLSLEGKGIVVFDLINNREIFSKNSDMPLPLASLTKVMTAIIAEEKLSEDQQIEITKEDLSPEGDSKLLVGDTWLMRDLRDFTLLTSSNDGAFALAAIAKIQNDQTIKSDEDQFVKEMNDMAIKIGLLNSKFFNEHGLDREADRGGAYGSARDMASLFAYVMQNYPTMLEATRYKNLQFASTHGDYSADNTNILVDKIPNLIASKTGYTDLAGGNLVVAFDAGLNRPIIISVLGSTESGRFTDVQKLVEASLKYIHDN